MYCIFIVTIDVYANFDHVNGATKSLQSLQRFGGGAVASITLPSELPELCNDGAPVIGKLLKIMIWYRRK